MRTVKVGLIGLGTVGSGVVEIFRRHREDFQRRVGVDVELTRFADRDTARFADLVAAAPSSARPTRPSSSPTRTWTS